ncbi:50S ribosomal protein L17 [Candidatus Jorgensenbacteria bacterium]|nr:50S ribosomal protein L17 [Candidatus Jorgensenbacteria bacterium]
MRHLKKGRKFGLKRGKRRSFLRILANNLIQREKIITTEARAKELRPIVERLVTYSKEQTPTNLRLLLKKLPKQAAYKMYHEIGSRYRDRRGGYTRIVKIAKRRQHDASRMARIEFI